MNRDKTDTGRKTVREWGVSCTAATGSIKPQHKEGGKESSVCLLLAANPVF